MNKKTMTYIEAALLLWRWVNSPLNPPMSLNKLQEHREMLLKVLTSDLERKLRAAVPERDYAFVFEIYLPGNDE